MLAVMSYDVHGLGGGPARLAPPPGPMLSVTQRDVAVAARLGVQAVPVRQLDPVTAPAKRERAAESVNDRKAASDADRLAMLRLAALRRDAAAITGR
jgi:hypothetical protein